MDSPLEIAWHNVEKSEALEDRIRERVDKLHRYFNRINSCHIVVERPHRSQHHGKEFHLRIEVRVPEREIVISGDPGDRKDHFDPNIAIRDAFDAMERRLEAHSQKMRGETKILSGPPQGVVVRKFDEYGFVRMSDGQEIYFAPNAVLNEGFGALAVGSPVELTVAEGEGAMGPQASMVRPISEVSLESERREEI
ncbi:HPF/RaiA family ribosome-associated protein [Alterinioella nitratireducens]|uniref:HPF/RaiA family ribosome-associated protein n=1 Tax=Alterinioella nitratireducens TaxID=2735915 RepID=UPI0015577A34|nr:HPF/RaiA family ribosome-associated protein [Alterinioella nitratireducens]NPD21767.1 HPF/RaiA family ribosome-associated protein [Alterinioella nitratireducens]